MKEDIQDYTRDYNLIVKDCDNVDDSRVGSPTSSQFHFKKFSIYRTPTKSVTSNNL